MTRLPQAVENILTSQKASGKPLAVIVAGHNGSGKSTMWYNLLADQFQIPLINADRMMLAILPDALEGKHLPEWAATIRDHDKGWMQVAQKGVDAFAAQAMMKKVPFAIETVFSHWKKSAQGRIESKIDLIHDLQEKGYFVLLLFVGLSSDRLSIARVSTRVANGGHDVLESKLISRFPRTQRAIREAIQVADAAILTDNSRLQKDAFTVCRVQLQGKRVYDCRGEKYEAPCSIRKWLDVVCLSSPDLKLSLFSSLPCSHFVVRAPG
jgi:predicted ABC-type ATPase